MKKLKYLASLPDQCFPGQRGWEFLPEGYTGNRYGRVSCHLRKNDKVTADNRPLRNTAEEAIQDCLRYAREYGITGEFAIYTEEGWQIFNL